MACINKSVRCAKVTGEPWRAVLDKFVKNYRATTHPSTGYTPNELMGFSDEIDLPTINFEIDQDMYKKVKLNDNKAKLKMKTYADAAQHTKQITFKEGDKVLYKWPRNNKFQSLFDPKPYIVSNESIGSMIIAKRSDHQQ